MQTEAEPGKMDYDELTLNNPLLAEIEAETAADGDAKGKQRRYWTPKEEERFFEIWGRDNWRLTRHGKNTVYFAHWSNELKERFSIDVKPEEIQAKVNQTRAKFRQVKKHLDLDKNATRWKKYDIIDKILKNQYRPEDAEPVPPEALENNRDISADELTNAVRQSTPTSSASNSTQDAVIALVAGGAGVVANEQQINVDPSVVNVNLDLSEHNMSGGLFDASGDSQSRANYSTELFTDQIDEIKQEFDEEKKRDEFQSEYQAYQQQYQETNHYSTPEPQLHQLQTPQQQQLQQQQQQLQTHYPQPQQYSADQSEAPALPPAATTAASVAHQHLQQHVQQLRQQQQQGVFEHTPNAYPTAGGLDNQVAAITPATENRSVLLSNQPTVNSSYTNSSYAATNNITTNNSNNNNNNSMQPPRPTQQRKRRGSAIHNAAVAASNAVAAAAALTENSVESQYLEEVRKRNHLLEEQKDISRQRLQLEERKVALMEQFFPKCLELQEQILLKLNAN